MARVGVVHVLKHWLESSKTYYGPINLRFTWPIELTKTHLLLTDYNERWIVDMLGNRHHGFSAWLLDNQYEPDKLPITVEIYHHGRKILKYTRNIDDYALTRNSLQVTEAHIAIPVVLYVHRFKISWTGDKNNITKLQLVRTKSVIIDMQSYRPNRDIYWIAAVFTCSRYRSYKSIPITTSYLSLLRRVAELAE